MIFGGVFGGVFGRVVTSRFVRVFGDASKIDKNGVVRFQLNGSHYVLN